MIKVQFPDGDVVSIAPGTIFAVTGTSLTLTYLGTQLKQYTANSVASARTLRDAIANAPDQAAATVLVDIYTLTRVDAGTFQATTGAAVTVYGTNFDPAASYKLYVEDEGGSLDLNGAYFTCTWVDANTLSASYTTDGDGILPAGGALLVVVDGAGKKTNILYATVDGSRNVTVDQPAASVFFVNKVEWSTDGSTWHTGNAPAATAIHVRASGRGLVTGVTLRLTGPVTTDIAATGSDLLLTGTTTVTLGGGTYNLTVLDGNGVALATNNTGLIVA